ncbi:MAG TPA: peptidylprolyl isomerase [Candidatus Saccharimonadales bacterium]|nr:peptidylprolyl isomerase [Candidatus Saccharimonadales bacterium]
MKTLSYIVIFILIAAAILFVLVKSGDSNKTLSSQDSQKQEDQKSMDKKTYTAAPATLPANELVGKKAKFTTNKGAFTVALFGDKTPKTVSNFITLSKDGFYNGLIFHRVIPNFMIQGGDPLGNGTGDPGYKFEDEFDSSLTFSKPGMLAMANSGPNTNGSQFFITVAQTPWLNGKHTIFGEVVEGMDVVNKISQVPTDKTNDKPIDKVEIQKIEII